MKGYNWQQDFLKQLPAKQYGRKYDDKLNNAAKTVGGKNVDVTGLKNFIDTMSQKAPKNVKKSTNGYSAESWDAMTQEQDKIRHEREKQQAKQQAPIKVTATSTPKKSASSNDKMSLYDKLNSWGQRAGEQVWRSAFGNEFVDSNNQWQRDLSKSELKKNPNDVKAKKALMVLNDSTKKASTTGEKALNYLGGTVGTAAPYLIGDGLLGVAEKGATAATKGTAQKVLTNIVNPAKLVESAVGKKAIHGAMSGLVGGAVDMGTKSAMSNEHFTPKQVAENLLINAGLGGGGNVALHGLGSMASKGLGKFAKGEVPTYTGKPSQSTLDALAPKPKGSTHSNTVDDLINKTQQPKYEMPLEQRIKQIFNKPKPTEAIDPKVAEYKKEYQDAVQQQYNYLKNSMGKGVDYGTTGNGLAGQYKEVNGSYSVSKNPKWYQDFYATNNRKPTNAELHQLAEEHVQKGFADEVGNLPPFAPKRVQEIDSQIEEIHNMLQHSPHQAEALHPILSALQEDRANAMDEFNQIVHGKSEPVTSPVRSTKLEDVVKEHGYEQVTPETIANSYNNKTWYHGTGTRNLTPDTLDPFVGDHQSLFGHGIYLTDEPKIAEGYAKSRSKRTGTPTTYETNVKMGRVLDLEQPTPNDAKEALLKFTKPLDYQYKRENWDETPYFSNIVNEMADKGATTEQIIQRMRQEVGDCCRKKRFRLRG